MMTVTKTRVMPGTLVRWSDKDYLDCMGILGLIISCEWVAKVQRWRYLILWAELPLSCKIDQLEMVFPRPDCFVTIS